MAEFGFSIVGLIKAINDYERIRDSVQMRHEYVVSTDAEAAPYGKFVEEGTRFMAPRRFMKKARNKSIREQAKWIGKAEAKSGIGEKDFGEVVGEEWAKFTKKAGRKIAPKLTGTLALGDDGGPNAHGKGIHWFRRKPK